MFDTMVGSILFAFLFIFSFVGFVGRIQAALLFNIKFANSLKRGRLLVCIKLIRDWHEIPRFHFPLAIAFTP